jgi:hypothetical protein
LTVEECFRKVRAGEMSESDARNEVACLEIEEAYRFEQLMGNTHTHETPFRLFVWEMDWAFGEEMNDSEVLLADQMRGWEQEQLRKMQEEGILSPFTQWRTVNEEVEKEGLDLGRLYKELRSLGRGRHTGLNRGNEQVDTEWQPDGWIRTSVWILEAVGGGHQEGVANLRSLGLRIRPLVYTA